MQNIVYTSALSQYSLNIIFRHFEKYLLYFIIKNIALRFD